MQRTRCGGLVQQTFDRHAAHTVQMLRCYKANMRIEVTREACCSQDDQLGPLTLQIELAEESVIWELARKIGEANFLQFSSPRNVIDAYCAGKLLFSIPAVGASSASVSYAVGRDDSVNRHLREPRISCVWPGRL